MTQVINCCIMFTHKWLTSYLLLTRCKTVTALFLFTIQHMLAFQLSHLTPFPNVLLGFIFHDGDWPSNKVSCKCISGYNEIVIWTFCVWTCVCNMVILCLWLMGSFTNMTYRRVPNPTWVILQQVTLHGFCNRLSPYHFAMANYCMWNCLVYHNE